jgi:histidyl-tRNA synthetase
MTTLPTLPRGFQDRDTQDILATNAMIEKIRAVYSLYGFDALETPFIEYTQALGKFLPDTDRPNAGVFSFKDDDEEWVSLRYDLTAPLARYVAANYESLPKPYRSYRQGFVFRNEKPGPGRFRQFMQFDADTVGTNSPASDAEICMMAADTMEVLGVKRGDYVVKVNNRKILDGVLALAGLEGEEKAAQRLIVLRAIDKLDKFGEEGVKLLLGAGRKDPSGDFTKGAGLNETQIDKIIAFTNAKCETNAATLSALNTVVEGNERGLEGVNELVAMSELFASAGFLEAQILIDPSVVRGLEYYTGPVYEVELNLIVPNEKGEPVRFGSVAGGGRYDGLIARFRQESVPATGFSIGVSRLLSALKNLGQQEEVAPLAPVVVLVMDKDNMAGYQKMVTELRQAGVRAELYLGTAGMKAQMKYADKRNSPCVIIEGSNEREQGKLMVKDLVAGKIAAATIVNNADYKAARPAQIEVKREDLVSAVKAIVYAAPAK